MTIAITAQEAFDLIRQEDLTVKELEGMGFTVQTAGNANVQVQVAKPPSVKPALVTAAALLFEAGTKRGTTKQGRKRSTLGTKEGSYPFNISVSIDPNYVPEA